MFSHRLASLVLADKPTVGPAMEVQGRNSRKKVLPPGGEGGAWPQVAHTMIGLRRLNNLQFCVEDALERRVPGDLIETGVWRGGACIFMRAILKAHGVADRVVWLADSFAGLPKPDPNRYP